MTNLCKEACSELQTKGFKKDIDPRSLNESFNLVKLPNGQWFKSTKPSLHEPAVLILLDLNDMPSLKKLTDSLDEIDNELKKEGGRIFIREFLAYKIKKGTQTSLIAYENIEKHDGKYRKLCDEMIENGLERDRYRTEETYMLTKTPANEWSITTSHENHSGTKTVLDFKKMPLLKMMASKINKIDSKFLEFGGRIFITPKRIYRLKNKVEVVLKP
ncbi:MAG: hypothetical protein ACXVCE_14780 [Bacteriovorax sp.]